MPLVTDTLETIFKTSGVQTAVNSMLAMENATTKLAAAQKRVEDAKTDWYYGFGTKDKIDAAQRRLSIAQNRVIGETFASAAAEAQPYLNVLKKIESFTRDAISAYVDYGKAVLNLQGLTGASAGESGQVTSLLRAAGINSPEATKTLLRLNKDVFSGEGAGAYAALGITPQNNETSLQLLNQVITKLNGVHDSMLKTQIETELFGESGATALQPLLRMSDASRAQILKFSDGLSDGVDNVQAFSEASSMLDAGWSAFIERIGQQLLPVLTGIDDAFVTVLDKFDSFNKMTNGAGTWIAIFVGIAGGIIAGAMAMTALIQAFTALNAVLKISVGYQTVLDALQGNVAALGAAAALAIGGYVLSQGGKGEDKTTEFGRHVSNFGASVTRFASNLDQFKGSMGPSSLTDADLARLSSEMAQGAIG